jgi:hypothetical protein
MGQPKLADLGKSSEVHGPADFGSDDFSELVKDGWKHRKVDIF